MIFRQRTVSLLAGSAVALWLLAGSVSAGVVTDHLIQIQGRVTDDGGTALTSGDLQFRVYDAITSGSEVHNSGTDFQGSIVDGDFDVCLGGITALNLDNTQLYYMEIDIDGDEVVGDGNGGRLAFYPGGGGHARTDLGDRLDALEAIFGTPVSAPGRSKPVIASFGGSSADYTLAFGLLGMGKTVGSSSNAQLVGNLLFQPVGAYSSATHVLYLGPFYLGDEEEGCCAGRVGDANGLGGDEPTIGDASVMIDAKFITGVCEGIIECLTEADINQSGGTDPTCDDITIGDISVLIDYLFITGPDLGLPDCL